MTPQEATTRWCPFAMSVPAKAGIGVEFHQGIPAFNRIRVGDKEILASNCIVDQCACWVEDSALDSTGHCGLTK